MQRPTVNLPNDNASADKVPIALIREASIVLRPFKGARRIRMIGVIYAVMQSVGMIAMGRHWLARINQDPVIDVKIFRKGR